MEHREAILNLIVYIPPNVADMSGKSDTLPAAIYKGRTLAPQPLGLMELTISFHLQEQTELIWNSSPGLNWDHKHGCGRWLDEVVGVESSQTVRSLTFGLFVFRLYCNVQSWTSI